jgi:DNA modification methylase
MSKTASPRFIFTEKPRDPYKAEYEVLVGQAYDRLMDLRDSDKKARCIITSPPYYRKFDYGVKGQAGLEDSLDDYLAGQVLIAAALLDVATPDANLFFVIQDSANGSGGPGGDFKNGSIVPLRGPRESGWPRKAQLLIPERLRIAFSAVGWIPRGKIIWDKKDSRRGSHDKVSYSFEEVLIFSASPDHYWNRDAVLTPFHDSTIPRVKRGFNYSYQDSYGRKQAFQTPGLEAMQKREGAFLRGVLEINPGSQPKVMLDGRLIKGIACFPLILAEICINLGSAPGDLILDPFSGMGTTILAAVKWGRKAIGFELNPEFARASIQRIRNAGYGK